MKITSCQKHGCTKRTRRTTSCQEHCRTKHTRRTNLKYQVAKSTAVLSVLGVLGVLRQNIKLPKAKLPSDHGKQCRKERHKVNGQKQKNLSTLIRRTKREVRKIVPISRTICNILDLRKVYNL